VGRDMPPPSSSSGSPTIAEKISSPAPGVACAFQFLNLGILAYTGGGSALAQVQITEDKAVKSSGSLGFGLWRSVYLSKQVSGRNRLLVAVDWFKTKIFGRDITRL
jgi:NADH dehydrogenase FAD-containing subunit